MRIKDISMLNALKNLTYLDLTDGRINDISVLSGMTDLTELYLGQNSIQEIDALRELKKLTKLDLSNNRVTSANALSELVDLRELDLHGNSIQYVRPLQNLTKLRKLDASDNVFMNDFSALEKLTELEELYLRDNPIFSIDAARRFLRSASAITSWAGDSPIWIFSSQSGFTMCGSIPSARSMSMRRGEPEARTTVVFFRSIKHLTPGL